MTVKVTNENIDYLIGQWHDSDSEMPLHEYLGLSWNDYIHWVTNGELKQELPEDAWWNTLYNADENCEHNIQSVSGGGVKCTKCNGWFCF